MHVQCLRRTTKQLSRATHRAHEHCGPVEEAALKHSAPVFLHPLVTKTHRVPVKLQRLVTEHCDTRTSWEFRHCSSRQTTNKSLVQFELLTTQCSGRCAVKAAVIAC